MIVVRATKHRHRFVVGLLPPPSGRERPCPEADFADFDVGAGKFAIPHVQCPVSAAEHARGLTGEVGDDHVGAGPADREQRIHHHALTVNPASLRRRLPKSIFLLPGYGTQGATAEMTRATFNADGKGAIISASRSILYAGDRAAPDWEAAVKQAVVTMREDLSAL